MKRIKHFIRENGKIKSVYKSYKRRKAGKWEEKSDEKKREE